MNLAVAALCALLATTNSVSPTLRQKENAEARADTFAIVKNVYNSVKIGDDLKKVADLVGAAFLLEKGSLATDVVSSEKGEVRISWKWTQRIQAGCADEGGRLIFYFKNNSLCTANYERAATNGHVIEYEERGKGLASEAAKGP